MFDLFFKALTPEQHASIRVVTGDGARWIDPCVGRWRPNAERVLDGFHIVSWMTDALDKVRKRLWNQARRDGDEKTTKRMRGVKYAVLKNPGDLTDRQSEAFGNLRNTGPKGQLYRSWQLGVPGLAFTHTRDRRTGEEDPTPPAGHPAHDPAGLLQRQARGLQQQDQGHHPHGLRLPPRHQPHRPDHAPMRWTRHPTTTTHDLTHENSRSLK